MKLNSPFLLVAVALVVLTGCGGGGGGGGDSSSSPTPSPQGSNVISITVNGSQCSSEVTYLNKPCVTITVCEVGTGNCSEISDILLDTMSSGIRIFKQALGGLSLEQVTVNSSESLAECVTYGDGSKHWGPVKRAAVVFGGESTQLPLQVIDADFGTRPSVCSEVDALPADSGFNGILGIGYWVQDCGTTCADYETELYWACDGPVCVKTAVPLDRQVQNPVALLSSHNNGFYIQLPSVPSAGSSSIDGYLVLGISNAPSSVKAYPVSQSGEFVTTFAGHTYPSSMADTGSNGLFFGSPPDSLPLCDDYSPWFCPTSTKSLTAINQGAGGGSGTVSFEIGNFENLVIQNNSATPYKMVFRNIGASPDFGDSTTFDWGLPFFLGRTVYFGIEGRSSSLGTGPYIAY